MVLCYRYFIFYNLWTGFKRQKLLLKCDTYLLNLLYNKDWTSLSMKNVASASCKGPELFAAKTKKIAGQLGTSFYMQFKRAGAYSVESKKGIDYSSWMLILLKPETRNKNEICIEWSWGHEWDSDLHFMLVDQTVWNGECPGHIS